MILGSIYTYRLVGADEIDSSQNWISIDLPMARAPIGKKVDDQVEVATPEGSRCHKIDY